MSSFQQILQLLFVLLQHIISGQGLIRARLCTLCTKDTDINLRWWRCWWPGWKIKVWMQISKIVEIINLKLVLQLQHMSAIQFSYEPASLPSRFDARQVNDVIFTNNDPFIIHKHSQGVLLTTETNCHHITFASLPSRCDARMSRPPIETIIIPSSWKVYHPKNIIGFIVRNGLAWSPQ